MDYAEHGCSTLPTSGAGYPGNPINDSFIDPWMHISSFQIDANWIRRATVKMKYLEVSDTESLDDSYNQRGRVGKSSIETVCITFIELDCLQA